MGHMKSLDIRIRMGGDDAIAAASEMADLVDERRGYDEVMRPEGDHTNIVTVLRAVGFAAVAPQAGNSASLLHYCVTHAADEIERLREERRWIPVAERLPDEGEMVLWHGPGDTFCHAVVGKCDGRSIDWGSDLNMDIAMDFTHWQPLPPPPEATPCTP